MIAYSVERYLPTKANIITLDCADGGYLYAGIKAYNSGVLLTYDPVLNSADKLIAVQPKKEQILQR